MSKPFQKILIANRGEIAVRILRTCRRMDIPAVTVYSEPDARSVHVLESDEAVALGGQTAAESYLDADRLVEIARDHGCDAIHPGYGFLSENTRFAQIAADAGITFIGPPADAIRLLGDKVAAKELAQKAGVPVIPGHPEMIRDEDEARAAGESVGYPVLLKPAAGGGGKGMRAVAGPEEMPAALDACRKEAMKAFGDDRVFIERYIEKPRHIEIQVLADTRGNVVHLGERECSIQRRYQKIIEEAPSMAVTPDLRARMGAVACALARESGYVSTGTVEFVLDPEGRFYFLEMNTRLQVEHPVTEMITGLDLVEMQIRVAAGEPLPFGQGEVLLSGWAIEARICAEDPARAFFPATGMITRYFEPQGEYLRLDSGVHAGSLISVYYDSLLAKVIAWGQDREEARTRLVHALNGYHIEGVVTNLDFVNRILNLSTFQTGNLSTDFIAHHFDGPSAREPAPEDQLQRLALTATLVYHTRQVLVRESLRPMVSPIGMGSRTPDFHEYVVKADTEVFRLSLKETGEPRHWHIRVDDRDHDVVSPPFEFYRRRLKLMIDGIDHRFILRFHGNFIAVAHCGVHRVFEIYTPREWELAAHMPAALETMADNVLSCPMPGLVVAVQVERGQRVYRGQELVTLESMKMESGVPSPRDGVIEEILVSEGQPVETGDVLVRFGE
jgi:propionyl-CoA carboxylase alpha chain